MAKSSGNTIIPHTPRRRQPRYSAALSRGVVLEILRAAGIRVLDVGSGRDEAWASIPPDRCAAALRALHARFFED